LMNILASSDKVKMLEDEVHFKHPIFKNTFEGFYRKYCNDKVEKYDMFLEMLRTKPIRGSYWKFYMQRYGGFSESKKFLPDVKRKNITVWSSFDSILKQILSDSNHKERIGIKYPAHYKYFEDFFCHYPDSKNIFLIRDPRAIIASKIISPSNDRLKNCNSFLYPILRFFTVIYFSYEYTGFVKKILENESKGMVVRYEDLVLKKHNTIKMICDYTAVGVVENMYFANGKDSGYEKVKNSEDRIKRWKKIVSKCEIKIINFMTRKYMLPFGYD
jgi:hypothetical protein